MNLTDALTSAAKGAALGGLVVDLAPEVGRWLFGAAGAVR